LGECRWVNHHLSRSNSDLTVSSFGSDFKDGVAYTLLMASICPEHCDKSPLSEADLKKRASKILNNADKMGCRKFVTPEHIVNGNSQLNMAFTALLFNNYPCLEMPVQAQVLQEMAELLDDDSAEASREERVFRNWMNSLGLPSDVNSLYEDCKNGEALLQVMGTSES
jgi:plastin-1